MLARRMEEWIFYEEARKKAGLDRRPSLQIQLSFPSILFLSRVFFFFFPCVIISLFFLVLNVSLWNLNFSNPEPGPFFSAVSAPVRKLIGDKGLRMVSNPFSGFDGQSRLEKNVLPLEDLASVYLFSRQ